MSTKEEIMDYVLHTPENVNPAILSDKLDQYSSGGGGTGGTMLITQSQSGDDTVLDKTYGEIKTALESGILPYMLVSTDQDPVYVTSVVAYGVHEGQYGVQLGGIDSYFFIANTEDGVLTLMQE